MQLPPARLDSALGDHPLAGRWLRRLGRLEELPRCACRVRVGGRSSLRFRGRVLGRFQVQLRRGRLAAQAALRAAIRTATLTGEGPGSRAVVLDPDATRRLLRLHADPRVGPELERLARAHQQALFDELTTSLDDQTDWAPLAAATSICERLRRHPTVWRDGAAASPPSA